MLIDWFTVCAQLLNFLILVWLLRRYLYQPVLSAIDAREKRIAYELLDAELRRIEARREREDYHLKNVQIEQQRAELLDQATADARLERQRLVEAARKDAEILRSKLKETVNTERESLIRQIVTRARREVFAIARKILGELAGAELDERMTGVFIRRLHEMNEEQRRELARCLRTPSNTVLVRSAFVLPEPQRAAIEGAINAILSSQTQFRFDTDPDVISGIELTFDGYKFAWSIAEYLASLSKDVVTALESKPGPVSVPVKETEHAAG